MNGNHQNTIFLQPSSILDGSMFTEPLCCDSPATENGFGFFDIILDKDEKHETEEDDYGYTIQDDAEQQTSDSDSDFLGLHRAYTNIQPVSE
jgi:hypothetical protein